MRSPYNVVPSLVRSAMTEIEQLEARVQRLSPEELAEFRAWFVDFDARLWDRQIEADQKSGKLESLIAEAREEYDAGKAREL